jgi:hypothetical protein
MIYNTFDSAFFITLAGIVTGVIGMMVKSCLKSKCTSISFCGVQCSRDVSTEEREHEFNVEHNIAEP